MAKITILGIDPGTNRIGHAVLKKDKNGVKAINYGCWEFSLPKKDYRLVQLSRNLKGIINQYKPDYLALEGIYFFKNAKTVMAVSEARGVILLAAAQTKIPVIELAPLEIKQKISGYGRTEKKDMQKKIQKLLKLKTLPQPDDTADALAIALAGLLKIR